MKNPIANSILIISLIALISCCENERNVMTTAQTVIVENQEEKTYQPHQYGGWYCPDNLIGLPAVDIANWKNVPVVNDRLPTEEETSNGTSLILIDTEMYPDAKPLAIRMPKLARFYNHNANRTDLVIVIQAVYVDKDSIVGFRYLNGGNGSARLNEVEFLSDAEIAKIPAGKFVSHDIEINAKPTVIWEIMTNMVNSTSLRSTFDPSSKLPANWRDETNINFNYVNSGKSTSGYGDLLFGNYYAQNDYENNAYTEKFLLIEDKNTGITTLKIVCGPFIDDYDTQKNVINNWAAQVKTLSEKAK